jgi:hypothetical protein
MADEFTGTNTEKIDKLIAAVVELKTTVRIGTWLVGLSLPFLVALVTVLVAKTFEMSSRLDRVDGRLDRMDERLGRIERLLDKNAPP